MQRSAHKLAKRRGLRKVSPQSRHPGYLLRAWIRLWLPLIVLLVVLAGFAPFAFGAPAARVTVSADVRPVFRLSVDDGVAAVTANSPWTVGFWEDGALVRISGGPTARGRVARLGETACLTVIADEIPAR